MGKIREWNFFSNICWFTAAIWWNGCECSKEILCTVSNYTIQLSTSLCSCVNIRNIAKTFVCGIIQSLLWWLIAEGTTESTARSCFLKAEVVLSAVKHFALKPARRLKCSECGYPDSGCVRCTSARRLLPVNVSWGIARRTLERYSLSLPDPQRARLADLYS